MACAVPQCLALRRALSWFNPCHLEILDNFWMRSPTFLSAALTWSREIMLLTSLHWLYCQFIQLTLRAQDHNSFCHNSLPGHRNADHCLHPLIFFFLIYFYLFWLHPIPQPEIEPMCFTVEVQSLNHWTTREVPFCLRLESPPHFLSNAHFLWKINKTTQTLPWNTFSPRYQGMHDCSSSCTQLPGLLLTCWVHSAADRFSLNCTFITNCTSKLPFTFYSYLLGPSLSCLIQGTVPLPDLAVLSQHYHI